jgi:hypothetical protein
MSPIPTAVSGAMYLAARAQAEWCDVLVSEARGLELGCGASWNPSPELCARFEAEKPALVAAIPWAVPLRRPRTFTPGGSSVVQWLTRGWGPSGPLGGN